MKTTPPFQDWNYLPTGRQEDAKEAFIKNGDIKKEDIFNPALKQISVEFLDAQQEEFLDAQQQPASNTTGQDTLIVEYSKRQSDAIQMLKSACGAAFYGTSSYVQQFSKLNTTIYGTSGRDRFLKAVELLHFGSCQDLSNKWLQRVFLPIFDNFFGQIKDIIGQPGETFSHAECAERFTKAFAALDFPECIGKNQPGGIFKTEGTIVMVPILKKTPIRTFEQAWRMFCHEGTHAITHAMGLRTNFPILAYGTAHCEKTQEGLAMLMEAAAEGTFSGAGAIRAAERYFLAGCAKGYDSSITSISDVATKMVEFLSQANPTTPLEQIRTKVWGHLDNAYYRAIAIHNQPKVYYTKLIIYWDALLNVVNWLTSQDNLADAFKLAFKGKYDFTSTAELTIVTSILDN